jgi:hypothetical protein
MSVPPRLIQSPGERHRVDLKLRAARVTAGGGRETRRPVGARAAGLSEYVEVADAATGSRECN